ncbi:hypothetical protein RQP46_001085 [Phenoliferia psychrophenolica]
MNGTGSGTKEEDDDEEHPADLRLLEQICAQTIARCTAHEQRITKLQHDIDVRISRWDSLVGSLKAVDERAHKLTERIHLSLHSLRTDTTSQLDGAKQSLMKADERVAHSHRTLRTASELIRESTQADGQIEVLEERLVQEEATLDQIAMVTQLMLWISVALVLVLSLLIAWWARRTGVGGS